MLCVMKVTLVPDKAVLHILLHVLSLRKDKVQFRFRETQMCVLLLAKLMGICQACCPELCSTWTHGIWWTSAAHGRSCSLRFCGFQCHALRLLSGWQCGKGHGLHGSTSGPVIPLALPASTSQASLSYLHH